MASRAAASASPAWSDLSSCSWDADQESTAHTSSAPSQALQEEAPSTPTHLIWCDEHYRLPIRQEMRTAIHKAAADFGLTLLCFKKAFHYSAWLTGKAGGWSLGPQAPHVLLTDWREFKPCNYFLENVSQDKHPFGTILLLEGLHMKNPGATLRSVRSETRKQPHRRFQIAECLAELDDKLAEVVPKSEKAKPAFTMPSLPPKLSESLSRCSTNDTVYMEEARERARLENMMAESAGQAAACGLGRSFSGASSGMCSGIFSELSTGTCSGTSFGTFSGTTPCSFGSDLMMHGAGVEEETFWERLHRECKYEVVSHRMRLAFPNATASEIVQHLQAAAASDVTYTD